MTLPAVTRSLADDEALGWLVAQPGFETTGTELAQKWGWSRTKVYRRLKRWAEEGHISREIGPGGSSLIMPVARTHQALEPVSSAGTLPAAAPEPAAPEMATVSVRERPRQYFLFMVWPVGERVGPFRIVVGLALAALACAIAWYGLNINAWYGATLGKTAEASLWLAGLSVAADILALILPAAAHTLWRDRKRPEAMIAWSLWGATIAVALLATIGFAAVNIADTTAARDKIADESAGLAARVARLRAERAAIVEPRSPASIEAEIQRAQPRAAAVWHATAGCTDVTKPQSGEACAEVLRLREAAGAARRRDLIDAELKEAEARLSHLPAVTTADPQADTAARLLNWLTRRATVSPDDVRMARVFAMALLPQISGLVFMLAMALWQSGRRREQMA